MGGALTGSMAKDAQHVLLMDLWQEHVETVIDKGLTLDGIVGKYMVEAS